MSGKGMSISAAGLLLAVAAGCGMPARSLSLDQRADLRRRAALTLTTGATSPSATVRIHAVEALQLVAPAAGTPYFIDLLSDKYRGVRFAALMALGTIRCREPIDRIRTAAEDPDLSVRAAAIFALHRLGDTRRTSELSELLLNNPRPDVRANTAVVLGRLGESGSVKLLKADMNDRDESVRLQVLEAMTLLGDKAAIKQLVLMGGLGSAGQKMVFAMEALIEAKRPEGNAVFEYQFAEAPYDEVKLAAAAGLAQLGDKRGVAFALDRLRNFRPKANGEGDTPERQSSRVKVLALRALGAAGDPSNLWAMDDALANEEDETVRVAAARAALMVLGRDPLQ